MQPSDRRSSFADAERRAVEPLERRRLLSGTSFADDFSRPDAAAVGNGWAENPAAADAWSVGGTRLVGVTSGGAQWGERTLLRDGVDDAREAGGAFTVVAGGGKSMTTAALARLQDDGSGYLFSWRNRDGRAQVHRLDAGGTPTLLASTGPVDSFHRYRTYRVRFAVEGAAGEAPTLRVSAEQADDASRRVEAQVVDAGPAAVTAGGGLGLTTYGWGGNDAAGRVDDVVLDYAASTTAPALPFADDFARANGPTVGNGWQEQLDAAWRLDAGVLRAETAAAPAQWHARQLLRPESARDAGGSYVAVAGSSRNMTHAAVARRQDDGSYYLLSFRVADGKSEFYRVAPDGTPTFLGRGGAVSGFSRSKAYRVEWSVVGTGPVTLEQTVTEVGDPSRSRSLTATDAAGIADAGGVGLTVYGRGSAAATGGFDDVAFEDLADEPMTPVAPGDLTAAAGDAVVSLAWTDPAAAGLAGVKVYRGTAGGGPLAAVETVAAGAEAWVDSSVTNGVAYRYAVAGVYAGGAESELSPEVTAAPAADATPALPFADDFARPDGPAVGNGWSEQLDAAWTLHDGVLRAATVDAGSQWHHRQLLRPEAGLDVGGAYTAVAGSSAEMTHAVVARRQADGSYYLLSFRAHDGTLEAYRVAADGTPTRLASRSSAVPGFSRDKAYRVEWSVVGAGPAVIKQAVTEVANPANARAWTVTDSAGPQAAGGVGLTVYGWGSNAATGGFDDVSFADAAVVAADRVRVPFDDAAIRYSPGNWHLDSADAAAVTPYAGASLRLDFTGTSLAVGLDLAGVDGAEIGYRIDGGPWQYADVSGLAGEFTVAQGLASGTHTAEVGLAEIEREDRWTTPTSVLKVTGLSVDAGAAVLPAAARPRTLLVFGDSITEGSDVPVDGQKNGLTTYAYQLGGLLGAEVGSIGFSGQGWVDDALNLGGVPKFGQTWDQIYSGVPRDFAANGPIDYVLVNLGTNDRPGKSVGGQPIADAQVTAAARDWLAAARAAVGAATRLLVSVPPGGYRAAALAAAVNAHVADTGDPNARLIDLGVASDFDDDPNNDMAPTDYMSDNLHPNQAGHDLLANLYAAAIQPGDALLARSRSSAVLNSGNVGTVMIGGPSGPSGPSPFARNLLAGAGSDYGSDVGPDDDSDGLLSGAA